MSNKTKYPITNENRRSGDILYILQEGLDKNHFLKIEKFAFLLRFNAAS
jgi:hypothetical protein